MLKAMNLSAVLQLSEPERYRVAKHFVADFRFDRSNLQLIGQQSKPFKNWDRGEITNLLPVLITGKSGLFVGNLKITVPCIDTGASSAPGNRYHYRLEEDPQYSEFFARILVKNTHRCSFQRPDNVEVLEVYPEPKRTIFPGLLHLALRLSDISRMIEFSQYLKGAQVIYLLGKKDQQGNWIPNLRYIGSATAEDGGAYSRLFAYHRNNHGNKLVNIDDPNDWFWKIVYVAPKDASRQQMIRLENEFMDDYNTVFPNGLNHGKALI
jgi:hypothetical protein